LGGEDMQSLLGRFLDPSLLRCPSPMAIGLFTCNVDDIRSTAGSTFRGVLDRCVVQLSKYCLVIIGFFFPTVRFLLFLSLLSWIVLFSALPLRPCLNR